jgi:hypothetical protein
MLKRIHDHSTDYRSLGSSLMAFLFAYHLQTNSTKVAGTLRRAVRTQQNMVAAHGDGRGTRRACEKIDFFTASECGAASGGRQPADKSGGSRPQLAEFFTLGGVPTTLALVGGVI